MVRSDVVDVGQEKTSQDIGNSYLLTEHVRSVTDTSNDTDSSSVGDSSGELRPRSDVHSSQRDGVLDLEELGEFGGDSCGMSASISSMFLFARPARWSKSRVS